MTYLKRLFFIIINSESSNTKNSLTELSDEDLVEKINKTNNTHLFSILYDRYSKKVYNKCYGFAKNEDEAKDLTQDVFLKLFIKLHTFKGKSKFSTWLYSFTYNFCVNYVNRDVGKKISNQSDTMENHDYYLSEMEDIDDNDFFEMKVEKLEKALEAIDAEDKSILLLKYQDDVSIKELQILLNISASAVKMRLKRAKIKVFEAHKNISS